MGTVWVTREEPEDGPLSAALRARGVEVILEPVIERRLMASPASLLMNLGPSDWLVLTSPFSIDVVAGEAAARVPNVAVVGNSSAGKARAAGLRVELVGEDGHGDTLFAMLRERVTSGVVFYPRSAKAQPPEAWSDVTLNSPVLYDSVPKSFDRSAADRADIAAVASPSAARAIAEIDIPTASIGRATTKAIESFGKKPIVQPDYPTFENLAEAIAEYLRR